VNSGNNSAQKLCKQFESSSASRVVQVLVLVVVVVVVVVVVMVMVMVILMTTLWKMIERERENLSSCLQCYIILPCYEPYKNRSKV
jgi:heme/copper-type cytochrome/quinol oxidase subunit 2